jgi:hypothetical protein
LPDRKKYKKKTKKDSQLLIRINGLERDRFVALKRLPKTGVTAN